MSGISMRIYFGAFALAGLCTAAYAGYYAYDAHQSAALTKPERDQARRLINLAREFSSTGSNRDGLGLPCTALDQAQGLMIKNNFSYENVGTTQEKFNMIRDYNGCKFN